MTDSSSPNPSYQPHPTYPPPGAAGPAPAPLPGPLAPPKPSTPNGYFNTLAIVSLVSSFFISVVAVVLGHIALVQIRRTGERGRPAALAGVIVGYVGIGFWSIALASLVVSSTLGGLPGLRPVADPPFAGTPHPLATGPSSGGTDPGDQNDGSSDLTFDAGHYLSRSDGLQISDGMLGDRDWAPTGPKIDGTWSYASKDGTCTATFHQGDLGSTVHQNADDDLTTTDSYLAVITGVPEADAAAQAGDDYFYYGQPENDIRVDARGLGRIDADGKPHITLARAFAVPGVGVELDVTCDTKSATSDAYRHVLAVTGVIVSK